MHRLNTHLSGAGIILLVTLVIQSCKISNDLTEPRTIQLPDSYLSTTENKTESIPNWKAFFGDPVLVALIDTAINRNYDLQKTYLHIRMAQASLMQAKGAMAPEINGVIGANFNRLAKYSADWAGNEGGTYGNGQQMTRSIPDYLIGFQASWEADLWGKLRNQKRAALNRYFSSIEGTHLITTQLIADVASTYYQLIAEDQELTIIRATLAKQEEALEVVRYNKEAGKANELAVQQFEAEVLHSLGLEKQVQQQIRETENLMNLLLSRTPQPVERTSEWGLFASSIHAGVPADLLQNRPDIREAELEVQAARFDVKAARAAFFPSLNITSAVGYDAFNPRFLFQSPASLAYELGGQLITPIVNRKAINAQFETAKASQLEALYNYQATVLNGFTEVYQELTNLKNLYEIMTIKSAESERMSSSVETSRDLYQTGRATYLEVLMAQEHTFDSQIELIDAMLEQKQSQIRLYRELGGGWK